MSNTVPLIVSMIFLILGMHILQAQGDNSSSLKASGDFGFIQIDKKDYDVSYTTGATVNVDGSVYKPQQGYDAVTIVFSLPDGSTKSSQVAISPNGNFQTQLTLDSCSLKGDYFVSSSYATGTVGALSFIVKLVNPDSTPIGSVVTQTGQNQTSISNDVPTMPLQVKPSDIFSLAKPGTVMIITKIDSSITLPTPDFDERKIDYFIYNQVNDGIVPQNDLMAQLNAIRDELTKNLNFYLIPGTKQTTIPLEITLEGSGFILNKDGYVVTNAHVISGSNEETRTELEQYGGDIILNQTSNYFSQYGASEDFIQSLASVFSAYVAQNAKMGEIDKHISVIIGTNQEQEYAPQSYTAKVIASGCKIPDKDVAILKIDGTNFYPLPLGNYENINVGDRLYILGFPEAATFNPDLSTQSQIEPSFTSGLVSAKKTMSEGWSVIQTDAPMTYGNSGGPVFDDNGQVVGISTFSLVDLSTGSQIPGLNYVIPTDVIKEFIKLSGTTYIDNSYSSNIVSNNVSGNSTQEQSKPVIPSLVKNTAKWWSDGKISDSDFIQGIQYLIQNGIMKVSQSNSGGSNIENNHEIPKWIKNNAGWWASGQISDDDFVKGIQYLIQQGIISIK